MNKVRKALPADGAANQAVVRLIVAWKAVAAASMGTAGAAGAAAAASVSPAAATPAAAASPSVSPPAVATKRKADTLGVLAGKAAAAANDAKRARFGNSLVAPNHPPQRSVSPHVLPAPTISLATLAAAHPPLPTPPPATLLYNPNLAFYNDKARLAAVAAASAANASREIDYTRSVPLSCHDAFLSLVAPLTLQWPLLTPVLCTVRLPFPMQSQADGSFPRLFRFLSHSSLFQRQQWRCWFLLFLFLCC